jgi:glycosyltransferase involved in cell wall biosynthesis
MKVAFISSGLSARTERLQPHQTLLQMARELMSRGVEVVLISDGASGQPVDDVLGGVRVHRVSSARSYRWGKNEDTEAIREVRHERPDVVVWHVSMTTLLHQRYHHSLSQPAFGLLSSPVQPVRSILALGPAKLSSNIDLIFSQLLGSLVPSACVRRVFTDGGLSGMITLSETTRAHLLAMGAPGHRVFVTPPGVAPIWLGGAASRAEKAALRAAAGFSHEDYLVTYFGSPAPVRGVFTLVEAASRVAAERSRLRLLILSRRWGDEWQAQSKRLAAALAQPPLRDRSHFVDGYLSAHQLVNWVAASDAVCLPFELVPSDVPLSVLEAMALGQLVVTTPVACIPELVGRDRGCLVPAGSVQALAGRIRALLDGAEPVDRFRENGRAYVESQRKRSDMGDALMRVFAQAGVT